MGLAAPGPSAATSCSATRNTPALGVSKPAASASQVDLPLPDGPRSSSAPPCATDTSSKRNACPAG